LQADLTGAAQPILASALDREGVCGARATRFVCDPAV